MDIRIFKLNSGEHVIAEVIEAYVDTYKLKNHCNVFPAPDGSNGVSVLPTSNMFKDNEVIIDRSQIVYEGVPQEEIHDQFYQAFGVGLILPSSEIVKA